METYLFKFSACLTIFWFVYILVLERQNMHRFKRFYLITAIAAALMIPVLTITHYIEPIVTDFEVSPLFIPIESSLTEASEQSSFMDLKTMLWGIYGLGVLLFSVRFTINLIRMYKRITNNESIACHSFIYVLLEECRIPHSFFRYVFFNKSIYQTNAIPKEVMLHEETHAKQLHSLDIMAIELIQIIFWFHPLIYILKHHIKLNHEFLADKAVLEQGTDTKVYQNILLQFTSNAQEYQLSSAINYSSIKKRFTVMKTQTSKTRIWLSSLLLLPILAILFYSFSTKEYVERTPLETSEILQLKIDNEGATEAMMKEYNEWIIQFTTTHYINQSQYKRIVSIYELMTKEQRNSVERYPTIPDIDLSKIKPVTPTEAQFEAWKNEKKFVIWIDGKHVQNSKLNNYKPSDIIHFVGSKVYDNARSEKFHQPFQFALYTKEGFKTSYQESAVNGYKEAYNVYALAIKKYLKGSQTDNTELRILKVQADELFNSFTKEELKKYNLQPVPSTPTKKNFEKSDKPLKEPVLQQEATLKQISEYNNWAKKINTQDVTMRIIKRQDLKKYSHIYGIMSKTQKENAESFPQLPPPPPPPPIKKGKVNNSQIEAYNIWAKNLKDPSINNRMVKKEDYEYFMSIYNHMTNEQKKNSVGLPPPPPPPKNPSFLEYIIDMEKQGASFFLDGEKITADTAKEIAKNNKGKSTDMLTQKGKNGNYIVKLSSPKDQEPESTLDFVIRMAKTNAKFFYESNSITSDKAIELLKRNSKLNINAQKSDKKQPLIYISKKPIVIGVKGKSSKLTVTGQLDKQNLIVNGKTIESGIMSMTLNEIKKLELTLAKGKIIAFKLKIPGVKTERIESHTISKVTLKNLESAMIGDIITIFDIKDGKNSKFAPLAIKIIE